MGTRDLLIKIVGDPKSAVDAFDRVARQADVSSDRMTRAAKLAGAAFLAMGAAAISFGAQSVRTFERTAAAVDDLQDVTGESAAAMSRLQYAFESWGVSGETMTVALRSLTKAVGSGNDAFAAYGIRIRDAAGATLPMSTILANTSDVFARLPDGVDKSNLALTLFGKRGIELLDVLNEGSSGLAALGAEADRFGITMDDAAVAAQQANAKMERQMSAAWKGLQIQLGQHLMPIVTKFTLWLAERLPGAIATVRSVMTGLAPVFAAAAAAVRTTFEVVRTVIEWLVDHKEIMIGVATGIGVVVVSMFVSWATAAATAAVATIAANAPLLLLAAGVAALAAGVVWLVRHMDGLRDAAAAVGRFFTDVLWPAIKKVWDVILDLVQLALLPLRLEFELVRAVVVGAWEAIKSAWDHMLDFFSAIWAGIRTGFSKVTDFITAPFKAAFNFVARMWNDTVGGFGFSIPSWVPVVGGKEFRIPEMPTLHTGGIVPGIAGEEVLVRAQAGERLIGTRAAQQSPGDLGDGSAGGLQLTNIFHGITDVDALTRAQAREFGWMLRTA